MTPVEQRIVEALGALHLQCLKDAALIEALQARVKDLEARLPKD